MTLQDLELEPENAKRNSLESNPEVILTSSNPSLELNTDSNLNTPTQSDNDGAYLNINSPIKTENLGDVELDLDEMENVNLNLEKLNSSIQNIETRQKPRNT